MAQVEELMGKAIAAKYVQDSFNPKAKEDVEKLVEKLMNAFLTLVEESTWMDEATKQNAMLKASAMNVLVGHPQWMQNNTIVDQKYEEVFDCIIIHQLRFMICIFHRLIQTDTAILRITFKQKSLIQKRSLVNCAKRSIVKNRNFRIEFILGIADLNRSFHRWYSLPSVVNAFYMPWLNVASN